MGQSRACAGAVFLNGPHAAPLRHSVPGRVWTSGPGPEGEKSRLPQRQAPTLGFLPKSNVANREGPPWPILLLVLPLPFQTTANLSDTTITCLG